MGDTAKAPFLPTATLTGTEVVPVNQAGSERKTTAQAIANLGIGPFPSSALGATFAAGGMYSTFLPASAPVGSTMAQGYIYGYWWSPGKTRTLTTLGSWVNANVAGAVGRVVIYNTGADGYPTSLVGSSAEMNLAVAAGTFVTAAANIPVSPRAIYFVGLFMGGPSGSNMVVFSSTGPVYFIAPAGVRYGMYAFQNYGTPPATFPAGAVASQSVHAPILFYGD